MKRTTKNPDHDMHLETQLKTFGILCAKVEVGALIYIDKAGEYAYPIVRVLGLRGRMMLVERERKQESGGDDGPWLIPTARALRPGPPRGLTAGFDQYGNLSPLPPLRRIWRKSAKRKKGPQAQS